MERAMVKMRDMIENNAGRGSGEGSSSLSGNGSNIDEYA
jgi:hypothetical protein